MADAISRQALSDWIGSIYDCALDPSRWDRTLADVRDALDCYTSGVSLMDRCHHRFLLNKTVGFEPYLLQQAPKYVPEMVAILAQALASWPSLDKPHVDSRHLSLSAAYIETSPLFQDDRQRAPEMRQQLLTKLDLAVGDDTMPFVPADAEEREMHWSVHQEELHDIPASRTTWSVRATRKG